MAVGVAIVRMVGHSSGAIERGADQFAIREAFLVVAMTAGLFGWHGVERIFQIPPPARWAGRIYHNT